MLPEYIGQLEGEVAQKASEADILREENEALKAENTRLTDLSKLLLSSPAFSSFLNDLSTNGLPASISAQNQSSQSVTQQPQSQIPKFATPQPSINTITEEELDFNSLEGNSNWQSGIDFNAAPQVFAVIDIPEGPVIDIDALAAKPAIFSECQRQDKNTVPIFKPAPTTDHVKQQYVCDDSIEMDESDPAFALYADLPTKFSEPECQDSGSIQFEKATETFELVCYNEENSEQDGEAVSSATMARFEHLCSCLDSLSLRLESFVSRQ